MRTLLNILWLITGGLWLALGYFVAGVLACLLIITIPVGVASFRMAAYALWPFGKAVILKPNAGAGSALMNAIWFLIAGWWLVLGHVTSALAQFLTIIGIPLGLANLKMIPVCAFPFGKVIVDSRHLPREARTLFSM